MAFLVSAFTVGITFLAAIVPGIGAAGKPPADKPAFPAPQGYLMPWAGGEIHGVSQGEETTFTHNGEAAYAFDFDLVYETVVAARGGKVVMVRQDSNAGGCGHQYSASANYVVVDHGDGTSGLYLHLASESVLVKAGDMIAQGDPIAISGETGFTCSDGDGGPGPHLHFQVERTDPGHYFTQSLPIAFDDIGKGDGVPQSGQSYVSANYGRGKEQRIKLTPHHVPREFNPQAQPENPDIIEADKNAVDHTSQNEPADPNLVANLEAAAAAFATPTDTPAPDPNAITFSIEVPATQVMGTATLTMTPTATETLTPTATATPAPPTATRTTTASATPAAIASSTQAIAPALQASQTPSPVPSSSP